MRPTAVFKSWSGWVPAFIAATCWGADAAPRLPLRETIADSARHAWEQKPVLESRLLDDAENPATWTHNDFGSMTFTTERARDGRQSVRLRSKTKGDKATKDNRPWGYCSAIRPVAGEDWSRWNRLSMWIYPDLPGHKIVSVYIVVNNDGGKKRSRDNIILENQQWNHIVSEFEFLPRTNITSVEIKCRLSGNEPGTGDTFTYDIDRLELQRVVPDYYQGWECAPGKIAFSHSGYAIGAPKSAVASNLTATSFNLVEASAGGSINVIPKRPQRKDFLEGEVQYGNYQTRYRTEVNRVLTPTLSTRLGVQYADGSFNGNSIQGQSNIPEFDHDRRLLVFDSTTWRPFANTELGFDVEQVRDRSNQGNRTALRFATVTRNGQSVRLPWYLAYNVPLNWSISGPGVGTGKDHRYITGRWIQNWAAHFKTEATIYNQWYNEKLLAGNLNFEESAAPAGLPPFRSLRVSSYDRTQMAQRTTQVAVRGLFDYAFRGTKHQVVLKYNYYTFYTDSQSYRAYRPGTNPLTGLSTANEIKGPWLQIDGATADQLNGYDRSYPTNLDYLWRYTQDSHDNPQRHQGNIIYTGEYPTRIGTFYPLAGISYHSQVESFRTTYVLVNGNLTNPTLPSRPHRWGSAPSAGIVYQITPAVGLYSSYLESFQVPTNMNSFNELLPNRQGVSHETGVKIDLWDRRVSGTFSYFNTTDKNRATNDAGAFNVNTRDVNGNGPRDPGFDPNNLAANTSRGDSVAVGQYNSKGWDFEVTLALARGLQAMLSTTLVKAGVTEDPNPSFIGQKLGGFAQRNYGAVVSYRFAAGGLKGLSLGGGYRYTSDRYLSRVRQFTTVVGSPFVDYWQPSSESLLVFSKYGFKLGRYDAWVQFNGDNLLKTKRYLNETSFTNQTIYGIESPVVWRATTGIRF